MQLHNSKKTLIRLIIKISRKGLFDQMWTYAINNNLLIDFENKYKDNYNGNITYILIF